MATPTANPTTPTHLNMEAVSHSGDTTNLPSDAACTALAVPGAPATCPGHTRRTSVEPNAHPRAA